MSRSCRIGVLFLAVGAAAPVLARAEVANPARALLRSGRYAEAEKAYEKLAADQPVVATIGQARCRRAVGDVDAATRILTAAAQRQPGSAALRAELAEIQFGRGDYAAAQAQVDAALQLDPEQPAARWFAAELHRVAGRLEPANDAYVWFVRLYNARQDSLDDPEITRWIGLAAAQYARWNRNSGQFHFLVNTLYPELLKRDSTYWPAHLEAARLFIEKYNRRDAMEEIEAGLAINPRGAELHAARALVAIQVFDLDTARISIDRALAIDPRLVFALQLRADVAMVTSGARAAVAPLEQARALNPADEGTLGRLAAAYGAIDGLREEPATRMGAVMAEAVKRNPHCGGFYAAMATGLDLLRKYPDAARYYEEAKRRMPQLIETPGQLGLVMLRLGDETRGRQILEEAFEIDPFNIRVKNSLEVLDVLKDYGEIQTGHFIVRYDRGRDSLLARYASRYLEDEVYPEIVKRLDYAPPEKSLIEIFSRQKGTSGHSWFSARMVGLPFIGTVGACAGKMVAITSPNDGASFNWARVLKHEFVHVVNLQQTDFNIPRWYTEGLAVHLEGARTPAIWDPVLARRAAADSLFDLDNIHLGFVRPASGEDWALAYCQAELYTRYMADTYGAGGPGKMIAAYAGNLDTPAALKKSFGITAAAFEKGYRGYLDRLVGTQIGGAPAPRASADLHALQESLRAAVDAKQSAAAESLIRIGQHRFPLAADWSLGLAQVYRDAGARDKLATLLVDLAERRADDFGLRMELAQLATDRKDFEAAGHWALEALYVDVMSPEAHATLARSASERKAATQAIDEYETAVSLKPDRLDWRLDLAKSCVAAGRKDRARDVLADLLQRDANHAGARELLQTLR